MSSLGPQRNNRPYRGGKQVTPISTNGEKDKTKNVSSQPTLIELSQESKEQATEPEQQADEPEQGATEPEQQATGPEQEAAAEPEQQANESEEEPMDTQATDEKYEELFAYRNSMTTWHNFFLKFTEGIIEFPSLRSMCESQYFRSILAEVEPELNAIYLKLRKKVEDINRKEKEINKRVAQYRERFFREALQSMLPANVSGHKRKHLTDDETVSDEEVTEQTRSLPPPKKKPKLNLGTPMRFLETTQPGPNSPTLTHASPRKSISIASEEDMSGEESEEEVPEVCPFSEKEIEKIRDVVEDQEKYEPRKENKQREIIRRCLGFSETKDPRPCGRYLRPVAAKQYDGYCKSHRAQRFFRREIFGE